MLKKKLKGSATVEAAFILPFLLFCIFGLIYLGFDLHDRVCLMSTIDKMGRAAAQKTDSDISMDQMEKEIQILVNKKLCITSISNVSIKEEIFILKINYDVRKKISLPMPFVNYNKLLKKQEKIKKYNPMKAVRSLGGFAENESGI